MTRKTCPRCNGKLDYLVDEWGSYWNCLYCGGIWDDLVGPRELPKLHREQRIIERENERKARLARELEGSD
ncbi:hypothetical protein LCGC14_0311180 [marine sediment metagenome]|uniref:Transcription factor zinc-finger domain-containing protein n=1 Tax=marine sediment metagenome TaxID=412755 RepID=A0A0F9TME7_9ZZZZ